MTWPPFHLYQTIHTRTSFFFFRTFSSLSFVPSSLPSTSPFSLTCAAPPLRTPTTRKRKQISAVQFWPQSLSHLTNSIYLILVFFKKKLKSRELWILSLSPYDRLQFFFFFSLNLPGVVNLSVDWGSRAQSIFDHCRWGFLFDNFKISLAFFWWQVVKQLDSSWTDRHC